MFRKLWITYVDCLCNNLLRLVIMNNYEMRIIDPLQRHPDKGWVKQKALPCYNVITYSDDVITYSDDVITYSEDVITYVRYSLRTCILGQIIIAHISVWLIYCRWNFCYDNRLHHQTPHQTGIVRSWCMAIHIKIKLCWNFFQNNNNTMYFGCTQLRTVMCDQPSLVQTMACCLVGAKPLSEPLLEFC